MSSRHRKKLARQVTREIVESGCLEDYLHYVVEEKMRARRDTTRAAPVPQVITIPPAVVPTVAPAAVKQPPPPPRIKRKRRQMPTQSVVNEVLHPATRTNPVIQSTVEGPVVIESSVIVEPEEIDLEEDLLFYVCMPKLECIVREGERTYYVIHSLQMGEHKLVCIEEGRISSSMVLPCAPLRVVQTSPLCVAVVLPTTADRGATIMYVTLPFGSVKTGGATYPDVRHISPSCSFTVTSSAVYVSDIDSGSLRLLEMRTKWPAGRLVADSKQSLYLCTHARLFRFSRAKSAALPVWEHVLHSTGITLLVAGDDVCVYAHESVIVQVDLDGDARSITLTSVVIDAVVLDEKIYATTVDGVIHVISTRTNRVLKRMTMTSRPPRALLHCDEGRVYYTTSSSVHLIADE